MWRSDFCFRAGRRTNSHPSNKTAMDGAAFRWHWKHGLALPLRATSSAYNYTYPRQHEVTAAVAREYRKSDSTFVPVEVRGGERIL